MQSTSDSTVRVLSRMRARCLTVRGLYRTPGTAPAWRGGHTCPRHDSPVRRAFGVPVIRCTSENAVMPTILFILLIILILVAFGGGISRPTYRTPGISVGTILLIVLLLWIFGVFGTRPW